MPFVEINGARLHFRVHGRGDPIVFCHGLGGNHLCWFKQIPPLVARGYQVIACDLRGFGFSSDDGRKDVDLASDLAGIVDSLGLDRVFLAGQSLGGIAVGGLASRHPERVRGLLLSSSVAGFAPIRVPPPTAEQLAAAKNWTDDYERVLQFTLRQDTFWKRAPEEFFLYEQIAHLNLNVRPSRAFAKGAGLNDIGPVLEHNVPICIISGDEDSPYVKAAIAELRERAPGIEHCVLAPSGHLTFFEQPEHYNRLMLDFLDRHRGPSPAAAG